MSVLEHKIDFVAFVSVMNANPNGDPLNGNRPRTDYDGFGEISDVCIKRKIRNRMQDMGLQIFVQSDERCDDQCETLKKRAEICLKGIKDSVEYSKKACEIWTDVRAFGQVFAFSDSDKKAENNSKKESDSVSISVRGPVSIHQAVSVHPVDVNSMQITKSVSGNKKKGQEKGSDTMGMKHFVRFGLYKIKGSINVQLATKTGFTREDADIIKECLRTLFVNDTSSARPDGSMEVVKLYWWQHNCKDGQYSSAVVHRSAKAELVEGIDIPQSIDDYKFTLDKLDGLEPEIISGL